MKPASTSQDGRPPAGQAVDDAADLVPAVARIVAAGDPLEPMESVLTGVLHVVAEAVGGAASLTRAATAAPPVTLAASAELARTADVAQYETGEGPCLEAISSGRVVLVADLAGDPRWRTFAGRAVDRTGIRSVLSHPLAPFGHPGLSLNLYDPERPDASSAPDRARSAAGATALAMTAAAERRRAAHLAVALQTNRRISAAVGIVMALSRCGEDEALQTLRRASQNQNRKLSDLAEEVIYTGAVPRV